MNRVCPTCSHPIPAGTRARFCPRCSLRGALELVEEEAVPSESGRIIGDYELLEMLGRGGMGVVYRARQLSLNRVVAVKVLLAGEFADDGAKRRFEAEATAAGRLRHPNIVAVHEIGEHEGRLFFSMELVEGRTFADLTRDGPLPPATAARLLKPVADAAHFAHEQGVLHRDLKPSNLMLDAFGQPRISDFGLARRLDVSERLTLTGEVLGSPSYLAPEQASGEREREGIASDVYSLGAILYHLLTGRPPFLGPSTHAILQQVIKAEPLGPRRLNPAIPPDLETICLKCLEKDQARRYGTAWELAEELERFLTHMPLQARPVGWVGRAWRWSLRHPAQAGVALATAITLLTLAVVPTMAYLRIRKSDLERANQFRETLLTGARAIRLGGQSGQRRDSWPALMAAAKVPGIARTDDFDFRLRSEAIANLAMDDAWFEADTNLPAGDGTLLRFDAGQRIYAVGSFAGPLRLVNAQNDQPISETTLTNETLQHVVDFSADGRFLALRHRERIAIRDLKDQRVVASEVAGLNQVAFQSDSKAALFLMEDRILAQTLPAGERLWERPIEKSLAKRSIALSPDDRWLAMSAGSTGVEVRDLRSAAVIKAPAPHILSIRWSRDGRMLAAGSDDGSVRVWEMDRVAVGEISLKFVLETHSSFIQALAFSPDGRWLAAAANDETLRLIDVRGGRIALSFAGRAYRLDFSPDGGRVGPIWKARNPGWLMLTNSPVFRMAKFPSRGANPTFDMSQTGDFCVTASSDEIFLFKTDLVEPPKRIAFAGARDAYFQPNGALLALAYGGTAYWDAIVEIKSGVGEGLTNALPAGIGGEEASFSSDRRTLAVANYSGDTADVLQDGKLIHRLPHPRICGVTLHPTRKELVSTSLDGGEIILWNLQTGQRMKSWPDDGANRAVFSPDGRWLAEAGPRCRIWDASNWQVKNVLTGVPENAESSDTAFSPDGRWLAAIVADQEVHLLRIPEFTPVAVLDAPSNARLQRLSWSRNGEKLAVLGAQPEIHVWDLAKLRSNLQTLGTNWD